MTSFAQIYRGNHTRPQATVRIIYGDFNRKGPVARIRGRGDACYPADHWSDAILRLDLNFLSEANLRKNIVRNPKGHLHAIYVGQRKRDGRWSGQASEIDVPAQNVSGERSLQVRVQKS